MFLTVNKYYYILNSIMSFFNWNLWRIKQLCKQLIWLYTSPECIVKINIYFSKHLNCVVYILTLTFKYTYIIFLYFLGWARGVRDTRSQRRPSQWRFRSTCSCTVTHYECLTNWIWFYKRVRRVLLVSEEAEDRRLVFKLHLWKFSFSLLYHAVVFLCRVRLDLMETLALKALRAKKWVRFNNVCFQIQ